MNGTKLTEVMLDCWSITLLRDAYSIYSSRVEPPLHKESWGNRAGVVVLCSSVEIRLYLVLLYYTSGALLEFDSCLSII